jgi:hypothetical protein
MTSNEIQEALVVVFNTNDVQPDSEATQIAKEFGIEFVVEFGQWRPKKKEVRIVMSLGMPIECHKALKNFLQTYKKHYRNNRVATAFYALTDEEMYDMFLELPYWMKSHFGNEQYMPVAENFLKEKLWTTNYPRKIAGDRRKIVNTVAKNWDEYIQSLPEGSRESVEVYKEMGMTFETYAGVLHG